MTRAAIRHLWTLLVSLNWALVIAGVAIIVDYWRTGNPTAVRQYFTYVAAPFYIFAGCIEVYFAYRSAKGFEEDEPFRVPWILLALAGMVHVTSNLFANVLNKASYLNPFYLFLGYLPEDLATRMRDIGVFYVGDCRFILIAVAFGLILRAEFKAGLKLRFGVVEWMGMLGLGMWFGMHLATASLWTTAPMSGEGYFKALVSMLHGVVFLMAIFIRSSVQPLAPGMISRAWTSYVWGIFLTCAANAFDWAGRNGFLMTPYKDLLWLIWFPQVTMFALGPLWQWQAMRAAAGDWMPALDRPVAKAAKAS